MAEWQFLGTPVADVDVQRNFSGSWMYGWDENGWVVHRNGYHLPRFTAVAVTQNSNSAGKTYNFSGEITNADREFTLSYTPGADWEGFNIIANGYTAPIDISKLDPVEDFENAEATIYIFNTGTYEQWEAHSGNNSRMLDDAIPGQYTVATPGDAKFGGSQKVIPAMQGFFVKTTSDNAKFRINYAEQVLGRQTDNTNSPMRAPKHAPRMSELPEKEDVEMITVFLESQAGGDLLKMYVNPAFEDGYENGFDARKQYGENGLPVIYSRAEDNMAIDFMPDIEGRQLGVNIGDNVEEGTLIITRSRAQGELYLHDMLTETVTLLPDQDTVFYTFGAVPGTDEQRFRFSRNSSINGNHGGQSTALGEHKDCITIKQTGEQIHVIAYGSHTMRLFDATGRLVNETPFTDSYSTDISALPHGVYTVQVGRTTKKIVL